MPGGHLLQLLADPKLPAEQVGYEVGVEVGRAECVVTTAKGVITGGTFAKAAEARDPPLAWRRLATASELDIVCTAATSLL